MTPSTAINTKHPSRTPLIAGVSLAVLALAVAIIAAKPDPNSAAPAGTAPAVAAPAPGAPRAGEALSARETGFDFGSISMAAGNVSHRYWFKNDSVAPVLIRRIYTSCMCTTATLVKGMRVIGRYGMPGHGPVPEVNQSLAPAETAYVDVVFDPAAHGPAGLGRTERVVTVEGDTGQPLLLGFVADVRP